MKIEGTSREIADLIRQLQDQPDQNFPIRELLSIDDEEEKRVRGAKL